MQGGKLDRRIRIVRPEEGEANGFNERETVWVEVASVWASKSEIRDSERIAAREHGAELGYRFEIRYSAAVAVTDPKCRVEYPIGDPPGSGTMHDVLAVKEIGRRRGLEITTIGRSDRG